MKAGGYGGAENAARAGVELKNMDLRRVSVESGNGTRVTNEIRSSRIEFRSGVLEDVAKGKPKSARFGLSGVVGRVGGFFMGGHLVRPGISLYLRLPSRADRR